MILNLVGFSLHRGDAVLSTSTDPLVEGGIVEIVEVDTIPYEFNIFMMTKMATQDLELPTEYLIANDVTEETDNINRNLINKELAKYAVFTKTNSDLESSKLNTGNGLYLHGWKLVTPNKIILGINSIGGDTLRFYDYDSEEHTYIPIEGNYDISVTNLNPDAWNMTLIMYSSNLSDITNFSPVIHNISRRPHRIFDDELDVSKNIGKSTLRDIINTKGTDMRNQVNYMTRVGTQYINQYFNSSIDNMKSNRISEYSDKTYTPAGDESNTSVGDSYATFLGLTFKYDSGSGAPMGNVNLKKSEGNYQDIIAKLAEYADVTVGDGWYPIDTIDVNIDKKRYIDTDLNNPYYLNAINNLQEYNYTDEYSIGDIVIYELQVYRSTSDKNKMNIPNISNCWIKI